MPAAAAVAVVAVFAKPPVVAASASAALVASELPDRVVSAPPAAAEPRQLQQLRPQQPLLLPASLPRVFLMFQVLPAFFAPLPKLDQYYYGF